MTTLHHPLLTGREHLETLYMATEEREATVIDVKDHGEGYMEGYVRFTRLW